MRFLPLEHTPPPQHAAAAAAAASVAEHTREAAGLRQQEGAPGHEEEERRLQQREAVQLGKLGHVTRGLRLPQHTPQRYQNEVTMSLTSNIIINHNQYFSAIQDLVMNVLLNFLLKKLLIMPFLLLLLLLFSERI